MKTQFLSVCLVVALASLASAAEEAKLSFQEVRSEAGRFAVEMPGKPIELTKDIGSGIKENRFVVPVSSDRAVFNLTYLDLDFDEGRDPQQIIQLFRRGFRKGAALENDNEIALGEAKIPGREHELKTDPEFYVRERMFLDGKRLYILFVGSEDKAYLRSTGANRFFDSLKIRD